MRRKERARRLVRLGAPPSLGEGFAFNSEAASQGRVRAHASRSDAAATLIVERRPETRERWGFAAASKEETVPDGERAFERRLEGHRLVWNAGHLRGTAVRMQLPRVVCERSPHENVVPKGAAAATGPVAIASGTRLAIDSPIARPGSLPAEDGLGHALALAADRSAANLMARTGRSDAEARGAAPPARGRRHVRSCRGRSSSPTATPPPCSTGSRPIPCAASLPKNRAPSR